jgi:hypothetical protein
LLRLRSARSGHGPRRSRRIPRSRASTLALALIVALGLAGRASAAGESRTEDKPAPDSVDEYEDPIDKQFVQPPVRRPLVDALERLIRRIPYLPEQSRLELKLRTYYLYGKQKDNSRREAWAYGGSVLYETGWLAERLSFGAEFFTSQPIHAPSDRAGTLLLRPVQRPYSVFGQAYAKVRLRPSHELRLYRQVYDTPYLNKRDNRMTPNTFEGYSLQGEFGGADGPSLRYLAGYVSKIKDRNSDRFVAMSQTGLLALDRKRGTWMAGALYAPTDRFKIGAINYYTSDVLNIFYVSTRYKHAFSDALSVRTELEFTDQRSVGDDLITGESFDTQLVAGELAASYKGAILWLAFSTTADEARIRSPWGSKPSPLNLMLRAFDRADEDAWGVGFSYDFRRLGLDGLSGFVNYARGNDAQEPETGQRLRNDSELNLTLDYRIERGRLRGLWFRVRGAFLKERGSGAQSQNQLRVIVNYEVPIL